MLRGAELRGGGDSLLGTSYTLSDKRDDFKLFESPVPLLVGVVASPATAATFAFCFFGSVFGVLIAPVLRNCDDFTGVDSRCCDAWTFARCRTFSGSGTGVLCGPVDCSLVCSLTLGGAILSCVSGTGSCAVGSCVVGFLGIGSGLSCTSRAMGDGLACAAGVRTRITTLGESLGFFVGDRAVGDDV